MAETTAPAGSGFGSTLTGKLGPFPVWVWAALGTVALALYLRHRSAAAASAQSAAAQNQTSTDLGSASQLANMFEVAGLMPYQGGSVYVNTTQTNNQPKTPKAPTTGQEVYNKSGRDLGKYFLGSQQASYVAKNVGKFGITKQEAADIQKAYANAVKKYGAAAANTYHYSWHGKGNVTASQAGSSTGATTNPTGNLL